MRSKAERALSWHRHGNILAACICVSLAAPSPPLEMVKGVFRSPGAVECYTAKLSPTDHDTMWPHEIDHGPATHPDQPMGASWGGVHVTKWTNWTDRSGQHHAFSPCSAAGDRPVDALYRNRTESMHSVFAPGLVYDMYTTVDNVVYTLGAIRNFSQPLELRWRLVFVNVDGFNATTATDQAKDELMFMADVGFHDTLVSQSLKSTSLVSAPVGPTAILTSRGRALCAHPTYGISEAPVAGAKWCKWDFKDVRSATGFQHATLPMPAVSKYAEDFVVQVRVLHHPDTFDFGSHIAFVGSDLRAREIASTNYVFDRVVAYSKSSKPTSKFLPNVQLSAKLQHDGHLDNPGEVGFSPPATMRTTELEPVVFLHSTTTAALAAPNTMWEAPQTPVNCTDGRQYTLRRAGQSAPAVVCFGRVRDLRVVAGATAVSYIVASHTLSLGFRLSPAGGASVEAAEVQVVLDAGDEDLARVDFVSTTGQVEIWIGLPGLGAEECDAGQVAASLSVYRDGKLLSPPNHLLVTAHPRPATPIAATDEWRDLPTRCTTAQVEAPEISICGASTARSGCPPALPLDLEDSVMGLAQPGLFEGTIGPAVFWDRRATWSEMYAFTFPGSVPLGALTGGVTAALNLSTTRPTNVGEMGWHLDCRPDIVRGLHGVAWANAYGGLRCVAQSVHDPQQEIDFIPVFECHTDTCDIAGKPYLCSNEVCVASPDDCRVFSTSTDSVSHAACDALQQVMDRGQQAHPHYLHPQLLDSELHRAVVEFTKGAVRSRMPMVMKSPTVLAYDDVRAQSRTEFDATRPLPATLHESRYSDTNSVLMVVDTYRDHTKVPFTLGATTTFQSSAIGISGPEVDLGVGCFVFMQQSGLTGQPGTGQPVTGDSRMCADTTTTPASAPEWHCAADRGGVALCPKSAPHRCATATPRAMNWRVGGHRVEITSLLGTAATLETRIHYTTAASMHFAASTGAMVSGGTAQITEVEFGYEFEMLIAQMAHHHQSPQGGDRVFAELEPSFLLPNRLDHQKKFYFAKQALTPEEFALAPSTYNAVWRRVVDTAPHTTHPGGPPPPVYAHTTTNMAEMTIYYCEDLRPNSVGRRAPSWVLVIHSLSELLQAGGDRDPGCNIAALRLPLSMGMDFTSAGAGTAARDWEWDGVGLVRAPFPVYNDFECATSVLACDGGLYPCGALPTALHGTSSLHQQFFPTTRQEVTSTEALCMRAPLWHHFGPHFELAGLYHGEGSNDMLFISINISTSEVKWSACWDNGELCDVMYLHNWSHTGKGEPH